MNSDRSSKNQLKRVSLASGGLVILLGIAAVLGWALDIEILKAIRPGLATMKANTAICFVLAGAALCLATSTNAGRWRWHVVRFFGLLILLISAFSLAADVFGFNPGIDQLLFRDLASARAPGRMSPATAFNWIAVSATLMLIATERKHWRDLAQWPALLVALASLVALAGYLYSVQQLYALRPYATVALHTAIGFLIVAIGLLCVPPHGSLVTLLRSRRLGGTAARLLLPVVIALPLVGGLVRLEAQRAGWVGTDLGAALFATGLVVMLVGIVWMTARAVEFIDARRERAVERLGMSEKKFSDAFQTSPAGITITRIADGSFIDVNDAFLAMFEFDREEVIGHTSLGLNMLGPEARQKLIEAQVESGGLRNAELQARTKSGKVINLLFSSKPIEWGGETHHITTLIDITERKQAEAALRETQEHLKSAVAAGSVGTWVWDLVNNRAFADDYLSELFSIKRDSEAEGGALQTFFQAIDEEDRPRIQQAIERTIKLDEKYEVEFRVLPADRKPRWLLGRGRIERDAAGNALRFFGMLMDITDRKVAELALRDSEEQLRALSARLLAAREEEGTRIAREIHDELGGALTGFKWDLEEMEKDLAGVKNGEGLGAARDRIPMLAGNIDSTIDVVRRISAELRPGVLDDLGLVSAIEWQAQQFEERTHIQAVCELCGDVDLPRERAIAVFRAFQEILTNVMRHAQATRIDIRMSEHDGAFVLEVKDNGRGISEAERANRSSLGLLGMRERVQLTGGEIEISGAREKGTRVVVKVPLG